MPKKIKEKRIEQSEPSCWSKFQKGKKWTFMLSQFLEWTFMPDQICRMKKMKKTKKLKKKIFFVFFFNFHSESLFFGPQKKSFWNFAPIKSSFFSFRKNVRSKNLFFVYLLVSKFQVQIPYPKPALNPKSLGFRILVFGWFKYPPCNSVWRSHPLIL